MIGHSQSKKLYSKDLISYGLCIINKVPLFSWCMCCNACHVALTELSVGSTYWFSRLLPCNYKFYLSLLSWVRVLPIVFGNFLILSYGLQSSIFFHIFVTIFLTSGKQGMDVEHSISSPGHRFLWTAVMSVSVSGVEGGPLK